MLAGYLLPPNTGGRGNIFAAQAIVTAPVIWTTAAGTGGPLLYNGSTAGGGKGVTAYLLSVSYGLTVASTVAGALGLTGGPTTAPTSTTAIDSSACLRLSSGSPTPQCSVYRIGTPSAAGTFFLPTGQVGTAALTAEITDDNFIHLGGAMEVGPGFFAAVAASATLTTAVMQVGLVWLEVPND
jgi:hypothetical protein